MGTLHTFPGSPAILVSNRTLSAALRSRRDYITAELTDLCSAIRGARLLCLGPNALRDFEPVLPAWGASGGEILTIERDEQRIQEVRSEQTVKGLQVLPVGAWPIQREEVGLFDFIYAPNLLNGIGDPQAKRALARLASVLKPNGKLLVTNYSPEAADSEYPIARSSLRSAEQLGSLTDRIPDDCFTGQVVWQDDSGLLVFLEVHR